MSDVKDRLARAQPVDLVFLSYVLFAGALVAAFGWKLALPLWLGLVAAHALLLAVGYRIAAAPVGGSSLAGFLRDAYPLFFIIFLYWELRYLALLFSNGYHDAFVLALEEWLFGEQLAMTFSQRFPHLWLSELMHFFYAFYWVLLPLTLGLLYLRGRRQTFRDLIYFELVVFFGCYLVFIFFPVAGPHYQFPPIEGQLAEGPLFRFVRWVLEDGGSKGAAFPSSHVAVAVTISLVTWGRDRAVWWGTLLFVIGLTVSTVYGRFHYGVDALGGVVAAVLLVSVAGWVKGRMPGGASGEVGNGGERSPV